MCGCNCAGIYASLLDREAGWVPFCSHPQNFPCLSSYLNLTTGHVHQGPTGRESQLPLGPQLGSVPTVDATFSIPICLLPV